MKIKIAEGVVYPCADGIGMFRDHNATDDIA